MLLPWLVGPKRAKEIILSGADRIPAAEANEMGLVTKDFGSQLAGRAKDLIVRGG